MVPNMTEIDCRRAIARAPIAGVGCLFTFFFTRFVLNSGRFFPWVCRHRVSVYTCSAERSRSGKKEMVSPWCASATKVHRDRQTNMAVLFPELLRTLLPAIFSMDSKLKGRENGKARSQIRFRTTMHGTVVLQVMLWRGWIEVEDDYDWDIFWCARCRLLAQALTPSATSSAGKWHIINPASINRSDVATVGIDSGFEHGKLHDKQRLNHFPRHMELTRKDLMVKNLKKWRRQLMKAGHAQQKEFWPQTFRLPEVCIHRCVMAGHTASEPHIEATRLHQPPSFAPSRLFILVCVCVVFLLRH